MRVLLWQVHGSWLDAFIRGGQEYLLPVAEPGEIDPGRSWPGDVTVVPADQLPDEQIDVAVLQRPGELALLRDWLGTAADRLPLIYVEHNAPGGPAATSRHPLADRDDLLLVHVTHFNRLMWDTGSTRTVVIPHGIPDPGYRYSGELDRQAVLINEAGRRGRAVGADLLPRLADVAPIDLYGIDCERFAAPGVTAAGNLQPDQLHTDMARRRLYLHTSRWTSLGLSLLEAMHLGMPVVSIATTEAPAAVPAEAGIVSNDENQLADGIAMLIKDPDRARTMGRAARAYVLDHFGLDAFLRRWDLVLQEAVGRR